MSYKIKLSLAVISWLLIALIFFAGLGRALVPLVSALILAYLFFPLIIKLEGYKIPRQLTVIAIFVTLLILLVLLILFALPVIIQDFEQFFSQLPNYFSIALKFLQQLADKYHLDLNLDQNKILSYVSQYAREYSKSISLSAVTTVVNLAKTAFSTVLGTVILLMNVFLFPMFLYYIINSFESLQKSINGFIPRDWLGGIEYYFDKINSVLSGFFRGQLIVVLIQSVVYSFGLTLIGLKFGVFIGIITGILSIIPYVGIFIGLTTSLIVGLATFTSWNLFFGIAVVFVIAGMLEGFIITPKIVGDKVGLSPLMTMLALIIAGNLFGIVGMLFAIPTAGIIQIILQDIKTWYRNSSLYLGSVTNKK